MPTAATEATIQGYYNTILARTGPSADEVNSFAIEVDDSKALTLDQVKAAVIALPEAQLEVSPIVQIYQSLLGREPDQAGLAFWKSQVDTTSSESLANSLRTIASEIGGSAEAMARLGNSSGVNAPFLTGLYQNVLGRLPDTAGFNYWLNSGLTMAQIEYAFTTSSEEVAVGTPAVAAFFNAIGSGGAEADAAYGAGFPPVAAPPAVVPPAVFPTFTLTPSALVVNDGESVTVTLNTTGVAAGIALGYMIGGISADELASGSSPLIGVFTVDASGNATVTLTLKPDATVKADEAMTIVLDNGMASTQVAVHDTFVAAPVGPTFALTTGVDTITPTTNSTVANPTNFPGKADDTFTGTVAATGSTLNTGDSLDGGDGANTLKIIDSVGGGTDDLDGVTLAHVQTVSLENTTAGTAAIAFAPFASVSKAIALNTATGGIDDFNSLAAGAQVVASGANTGIGTSIAFTLTAPTDAVSVGVDGGVSGVNINNDGGMEAAATISSIGGINGTLDAPDIFGVADGNGTVTTLAVDAATNLVAQLGADYAPSSALTVAGAASSVNLLQDVSTFATIDASGLTGGLTITTGAALTSLKGGAGDDVITLGAETTGAATVTGGGGQNTFIFMATPLAPNPTTIGDFTSSKDTIGLSKTAFIALTEAAGTALTADDFSSVANAAALAGGSVAATTDPKAIVYLQDTGVLYYNADGATAGGLTQIGAFGANTPLALADIKVTA